MEVTEQPKLKFNGVNILNINFNAEKPYDNENAIDLNIDPKVFHPKDDTKAFQIIMDVSLVCENFFKLKLLALGDFEFSEDINNEELKKNFVNVNAPAIMFPYVRAFINTLTSNLGDVTGALTIPTQFFNGDIPEVTQQEEKS